MAYFTKDIYDRKREYAYRQSGSGIDEIALAILTKQGITSDDDDFDDKLTDLVEELEPIADLSHERHKMHSSTDNTELDYFDKLGHQDSIEETLLDKVNALNDKYNIIDKQLPAYFRLPDISWEFNDIEEICDYFEVEPEYDDTGEITQNCKDSLYEKVIDEIRQTKDNASNTIRNWFKDINAKYDTHFPD